MDPVINLEEKIGKTVGRRRPAKDAFESGMDLQKSMNNLRRQMGVRFLPKGVYKFKSHEEADEWIVKMTVSRNRDRWE